MQILADEVAAWEKDRTTNHLKADRHFTAGDARLRLKHLYPAFQTPEATKNTERVIKNRVKKMCGVLYCTDSGQRAAWSQLEASAL
ncbi:MAG: hypothetical protein ACREDM_01230 [Methylocella sp.]